MDLDLKGKVALVTGSGRGIGKAEALVAFLCSPQAAFINEAIIGVDGGRQEFYWG